MKIQYLIIIWVTSILLLLVVVIPVTGQSDIVTNGADTVRPISVTSSLDLNNLLGGVAVRNVVESANTVRQINLAALSGDLQNVLANVSARIVFQSANTNRFVALAYPKLLLNDTVAPVINNFTHTLDGNSAKFTWDTNEFARCTLRYGTQSGNYTNTIDESLYAKQHTLTLPDLVIGSIYYVQVTCVDQSANSKIGAEFSFGTDKIAPEINAPDNAVTGKDVTVTWQTNESATTQIRYGTAPGNYAQTADAPGYDTTHTLTLNNLADNTYYAQIISVDQSGNQPRI